MSAKSSETPEQMLKRKGWIKLKTESPWQWQKPPVPGIYILRDAVSYEVSQTRSK